MDLQNTNHIKVFDYEKINNKDLSYHSNKSESS